MGGWLSKDSSSKLSTADEHHLARKCKSIATAYSKCHKANPNDPKACNNLQISLVMCYAAGASCSCQHSEAAATRIYSVQSCRAHSCNARRSIFTMEQSWAYVMLISKVGVQHMRCLNTCRPAAHC
jgi:hypothetical protein